MFLIQTIINHTLKTVTAIAILLMRLTVSRYLKILSETVKEVSLQKTESTFFQFQHYENNPLNWEAPVEKRNSICVCFSERDQIYTKTYEMKVWYMQ